MVGAYLRVVTNRAARAAWSKVIAHSWQALFAKVASTGRLLTLAYVFVHRTASPADDQLFSDQAAIVALTLAAVALLVLAVFLWQFLFVAPYHLWREETGRAEEAEATIA